MSFSNALSIARDIAIGAIGEIISEPYQLSLLVAALSILLLIRIYTGKQDKISKQEPTHISQSKRIECSGQVNVVLIACVALVLMMLVCVFALGLGYYTILELNHK